VNEMRVMVAYLLHRCDIELVDDDSAKELEGKWDRFGLGVQHPARDIKVRIRMKKVAA